MIQAPGDLAILSCLVRFQGFVNSTVRRETNKERDERRKIKAASCCEAKINSLVQCRKTLCIKVYH